MTKMIIYYFVVGWSTNDLRLVISSPDYCQSFLPCQTWIFVMQELDNQILVLSNQIIVLSLCHRRTHGSIRQSNLKSISLEIKLSPSWRLSNSKSCIVLFTSVVL